MIASNIFVVHFEFKGLSSCKVHSYAKSQFASFPMPRITDYGHPERKQPSLHGRKFNPNPKSLGMTAAYFGCHIGPIFQISLIYAFIGCPQSVLMYMLRRDFHVSRGPLTVPLTQVSCKKNVRKAGTLCKPFDFVIYRCNSERNTDLRLFLARQPKNLRKKCQNSQDTSEVYYILHFPGPTLTLCSQKTQLRSNQLSLWVIFVVNVLCFFKIEQS